MKRLALFWSILFVLVIAAIAAWSECYSMLIATIHVGMHPAGLAITPDNCCVYVADSGSNTVSVIDVKKNSVKKTIQGFNEPYSITINAAGTLAYVSNSGTGPEKNTVAVIDTATDTVVHTITGFFGPDGMVITPDGNFAYVANYGFPDDPKTAVPGTTVSLVDLRKNEIVKQIPVGNYVSTVAISPDGAYVYAANYNDGRVGTSTVSVIDTKTNTVIKTIPGFSGAYRIAFTPDCKFAYVTNFGSNDFTPAGKTMSVVDMTTHSIVQTIPIGEQPSGVAATPDGKMVCATTFNDADYKLGQGKVHFISPADHSSIGNPIDVGYGPGAIAITSDGRYAYVSNYITGTVNVLALPKISKKTERIVSK